jgi:hypothetical protein
VKNLNVNDWNNTPWSPLAHLAFALAALLALMAAPSTFASDAPGKSACTVPMSQIQYSASFDWQGKALKLRVGTIVNQQGNTQRVATISDSVSCQAVCTAKPLEKTDELSPAALDLSCWSSQMDVMNSAVSVLWPNSERGTTQNLLRFGTWVGGYKEAALKVDFDHFAEMTSGPRLAAAQPQAK